MLTATLSIPRCLTTVQQGVKDQRPDSRHVDTRLNGYAGLSGSRLWKIKKGCVISYVVSVVTAYRHTGLFGHARGRDGGF